MKIGFVTKVGTYLPLAIRCELEGHDTLAFYTKPKKHRVGEGIVEDTESLSRFLAWKPDIVIFDATGYSIEDKGSRRTYPDWPGKFEQLGLKVAGNSTLHDQLEFDREDALAVIAAAGISVPPTYTTASFKDAAAFVAKNKQPYAIKLDSEKYAGSSLTYVGKTAEDTAEMLSIYHGQVKGSATINLQEKVEGVEISTEGFFDGERFIRSTWNHTLERKKFMNDDIGPAIGCAGDVVWWSEPNKIIEKGLQKLAPYLKRLGFYGNIDLNAIVGEEGKVYALELTPRWGYNASLTMMNLLNQPFSQLLADLARRSLKSIRTRPGFALSVSVSIPPFPGTKSDLVEEDVPIFGVDKFDLPMLNPFDVYFDNDHLKAAGSEGWLFSPVGVGSTIEEAREEAYELVDKMIIPNKQHRTDIGDKAQEDYDTLKSWGMI